MEGVSLEAALRRLLARFKLPGEAQKIDRLMESFSLQYCRVNKKAFCKPESAYVLSFCIILLNTDLHNPNNNRRMTKEAFILNSQGTFNANDFSPTLLSVRGGISAQSDRVGGVRCDPGQRADGRGGRAKLHAECS